MKRCIFTKVKFMALFLFAALMAACTADVYEPKPDPEPDPVPKPEVPADGSFSISKSKTLTVNVKDEYNGEFYYTVEAFTGNPIIGENAKLISGSGQKTNSKLPYCISLNIPDAMPVIYIRVTDPFKRAAVYAFDVIEGDMICNIGGIGTKTKSISSQLRSDNTDIPEVDYSYGSDCIKIFGQKKITLEKGKTYLIPKGSILNGETVLPGEKKGDIRIYIEETWQIVNNNLQFETGTSVYILDGGKVETAKGNSKISVIGTSRIAVQKGGKFGDDDNKNQLSIYLTNATSIVNEGDFYAKSISSDSNASIYNTGDFEVEELNMQNAGNHIVNKHEFEAKHVSLTNGTIDNFCKFESEKFDVISNGVINLAPAAYMDVKHLDAKGLTLFMDTKSMWEGEKASFTGQASVIRGSDTDYALFKVENVDIRGYKVLSYQKKINVECEKHSANTDRWNPVYVSESSVVFSEGQGFVEIDDDDCNGNSGNHNPGEGDGDQDPSYEEVETLPYTYLFEDNWPATGDYDMNDLVIGIQINNKKMGGKTESAKIIYTLYATGATKQIGVGFQLDGIPASAVSGAEQGQTNAVIQLFSDAHSLLGSSERTPINTYKITAEPVVNEVTVNFNTPIDGVMNVNNFNLFIVTNGFDSDRRNEVHIAGYKGTDKAASSENSTANYVSNETGLMWALSIPSQDFATYPKETIRIDDAYEGFGSWIKGDNTPGWYLNYVEDNVIKYDLFTNKTE